MDNAVRIKTNHERLQLVSPSIREKVSAVLSDMEGEGHQPLIAKDVWRSPARQLQLFNQGRSKARWGFHVATTKDGKPDSLAVDIVDADVAWNASQSFWLALGRLYMKHGLNWGGLWGLKLPQKTALLGVLNQQLTSPVKIALGWDVAHGEVKGITINQAQAGIRPQGTAEQPTHRVLKVTKPYMQGKDVLEVQRGLVLLGYLRDSDGVYGRNTEAAVIALQAEHGLDDDGRVGPGVRKKINELLKLKG